MVERAGANKESGGGLFRALKMRPVRQVLLLARHASENASGAVGGCLQSVESAVLRAFEDASRTTEGCFWHRISLPYRRSLFCAPSSSENAFRAEKRGFHAPNISSVPEKPIFEHRMPLKMRRVPQEAFLSTARIFRTVGGPLRYRVPSKGQGRVRRSGAWHTQRTFSRPLFCEAAD